MLGASKLARSVGGLKHSVERLRHPQQWFQVTLSGVGDAVIAVDAKGCVAFLNPVAQSLTGWSQEEARGKQLGDVYCSVNEETREPLENPAVRVMRDGLVSGQASYSLLIAKDGRETSIQESGVPVRDSDGKLLGAVLVFRDTTDIGERRKAEETRALLAGIVDSSEDAIISKSLEGIIRSWNAAAERLFGYSAEEAIGKSITLITPLDRAEEEHMILKRLSQGERIEHFETIRVSKSGRHIDISLTISPIRDNSGRIIGASKIARDITEQKRAAEELRQQRKLLEITLSSIGDAVIATDTAGMVTFLNPRAEVLTGWIQEEAQGQSLERIFKIVNEKTREKAENPALRAMREGVITGLANHTVLISKEGRELSIDDSGAPIKDTEGKLLGSVLVFRDISERRQTEDERTVLLASERAARERAEAASRAKDEFVAMISHEIRSPLTSILGWAHMLRQGTLDQAAVDRALETIERNAKTQVQLIEDLLDISRVVTGRLSLNVRPLDVTKIIEAAVDLIRPAAEAKSIKLSVLLDRKGSLVTGDPDRLQQVFWNLLSNAVKFTPTGGNINVKLIDLKSHLQIAITDSGAGINPEFLPYVFDRFSQADNTSARKHGGLGLGLAIVRHLVELHGGSVRADSPGEGKGATFTVTFPARPDNEKGELRGVGAAGLPGSFTDTLVLEGLRVMIVDDEPETRDLLTAMLVQRRAEVKACGSAAEALAVIESWRPSVLVSDVGMPDEDGYTFTKRVRMLSSECSGIPAVALTAYARSEDRMRALASGFQMQWPNPSKPWS